MNLLPIEHITYKTSLAKGEVVNQLKQFVEPEKSFRGLFKLKYEKPYEGRIQKDSFEIKLISGYNSFIPIITGKIQENTDETTIKVKMQLSPLVRLGLCLFFLIGLLIQVIFLFTITNFDWAALIPLGIILFAFLLTHGSFTSECTESIGDLQRIFNARIIK